MVVERLLERQKLDNGGQWPETIAVVLWGTDNIKTYGESLAQVMIMAGVRPVSDALGRVNKLEVRLDPVCDCSLLCACQDTAASNSCWALRCQTLSVLLPPHAARVGT